ncbi:MAG: hypothetical protein ACYSU0_05185 [Planctomycetota bacterium]|jgi:hypothetical protein
MWLLFALAAILIFLGGIGGSIIVKTSPEMIPAEVFAYLPLAENIAYSFGIGMALLGVALCYRKIGMYGSRRGSRGSRRTGALRPPAGARRGSKKDTPAEVDAEEVVVAVVADDEDTSTRKMPGIS